MSRTGYSLEFETDIVLPFVQSRIVGLAPGGELATIGLRKDGELVAGVVYEGFNQHNIWMHVAALPGRRWVIPMYREACFHYPFKLAKVQRVSGYVDESNTAARKFDEHLGFREETRLKGAGANGCDVIIYVMWKDECRYVD